MQSTKIEYAVRTRKTGQFFAGFDVDGNPQFSNREADARRFDSRLTAGAQAQLLSAEGAQFKPAVLS